MGFAHWYEGIVFILIFSAIVVIPCFAVAIIGSRMINDLGNFPTKSADIQSGACWKVLLIEIVSFFFMSAFFHFFN